MSDKSTFRVVCISETLSPLTHSSGTSGNESLVMREPVKYDDHIVYVPCISGNAIRHRCIREPGNRFLVDLYGLRGKLSLAQLNFLFHGGNLTAGDGHDNTQAIAEFNRTWPLGRLLGGALPSQILSGCMMVGIASLACRENQARLQKLYGKLELPAGGDWRTAEDFVHHYVYTRSDAAKTHVDDMRPADDNEDRKSNLMIFSGQKVIPGASFIHEFLLPNVSRLSLGALLHSLEMWQQGGGTIGGKSAIGHGKLETSFVVYDTKGGSLTPLNDQAVEIVGEYVTAATALKDDAVAWLDGVFRKSADLVAKRSAKAAAKKPGKQVALLDDNE